MSRYGIENTVIIVRAAYRPNTEIACEVWTATDRWRRCTSFEGIHSAPISRRGDDSSHVETSTIEACASRR